MFATTGLRPATSYSVAAGTVAAVSTNPIAVGVQTVRVVVSTSPAWIKIGPSPTASATDSIYMPVGAPEYFQCSANGTDKISALQVSSAGSVSVTEMTQ